MGMMNGFGSGFMLLVYLVLIVIPMAKIVGRTGYNRWWTVLAFIPLVNLIALWFFAFSQWPALAGKSEP